MDGYYLHQGDTALILSMPHGGTVLPDAVSAALIDPMLALIDTDWWIEQLYAFAEARGHTVVRALYARAVIDLNRDPTGESLYPGQATTGLCPVTTFDGEALYRRGFEHDHDEVERRKRDYFAPYHRAVEGQIDRLGTLHRKLVLVDCHSIRSVVPRLFDGVLPMLNIGTNGGKSCDPAMERLAVDCCENSPFSYVANGRFRGGHITRHYGRPESGVHALQMEIAQRGYMDEPGGAFDPVKAALLQQLLETLLDRLMRWANN